MVYQRKRCFARNTVFFISPGDMVKLADTGDLKSPVFGLAGSSPAIPTIKGLGNRDISKSFLFFAAATPLRAQKRRRQAADFLSIYLDIGVKTILFRAILKRRGFLYSAGSITPLFSRTSENESYIQETQHLKPRRSVYESGASSTVSLVRSNAKRAPRRPPASFVRSSGSIMLLATATVKPR